MSLLYLNFAFLVSVEEYSKEKNAPLGSEDVDCIEEGRLPHPLVPSNIPKKQQLLNIKNFQAKPITLIHISFISI